MRDVRAFVSDSNNFAFSFATENSSSCPVLGPSLPFHAMYTCDVQTPFSKTTGLCLHLHMSEKIRRSSSHPSKFGHISTSTNPSHTFSNPPIFTLSSCKMAFGLAALAWPCKRTKFGMFVAWFGEVMMSVSSWW